MLRVCFDADIKFQLFIVVSFVSDLGPRHHRLMTDFIQLEMYSKICSGYEVIIASFSKENPKSTYIISTISSAVISSSKPDSSELKDEGCQ